MTRSRAAEVESLQLFGRLDRNFTPLVVLQACHMGELSGTLHARSGASVVTVSFRNGEVVAADSLEGEGIDALVAFARWGEGRFEFRAGQPASGPQVEGHFDWLLLEVCNLLDEALRVDEPQPDAHAVAC